MHDRILLQHHIEVAHDPLQYGDDDELHLASHRTGQGIRLPHHHPAPDEEQVPAVPRWLTIAILMAVAFGLGRTVGINAGRADAERQIWQFVEDNWVPRTTDDGLDPDLGNPR